MKVLKTTDQEAEMAKKDAWFALKLQQRLAWHQDVLRRIYSDRHGATLSPEAHIVRIKRG